MLWAYYLALAGLLAGFVLTGNRAALVLLAYDLAARAAYLTLGQTMPEWFYIGDVVAATLILAFAPVNVRNLAIVAGYAACICLYHTQYGFEWTRAISIAQFMLCWPWFASEWSGWFKQKVHKWMLRDRGVVVARVKQ